MASLEKAIVAALADAGGQLLLEAFTSIQGEVLVESAGARQRRRRRYLLTRLGEIRFGRWQTVPDRRYGHLLDEALELPARDPSSP